MPRIALGAFLLSLVLGACSAGIEVRSDEDPNADFSHYASWSFFEQLGIEGGNNSPEFGAYFRAAIAPEMDRRGYRQSDTPDLYVNVSLRTDDKVKVTTHAAPYMSGAYYRGLYGPYHGSAFGVGVGTVSRATKVTEASVFIDIVDNATDRLVWQGVAVAEANDKTAADLEKAIFSAVSMVFARYPYIAGPQSP